jgi:hypothetical protein
MLNYTTIASVGRDRTTAAGLVFAFKFPGVLSPTGERRECSRSLIIRTVSATPSRGTGGRVIRIARRFFLRL